VVVVDVLDVLTLTTSGNEPRITQVVGKDIYGNRGKRIGKVEDFVLSGGHLYAVVDPRNGPIERFVNLSAGQLVVIPWNELRFMDRP
ncbi:unnamed protein product, partial [Laminaria digitata]